METAEQERILTGRGIVPEPFELVTRCRKCFAMITLRAGVTESAIDVVSEWIFEKRQMCERCRHAE